MGLIAWLIGGISAMWLLGEIISRFERTDDHEHDWLADRKRKLEKRGYRTRMGVKQ